VNLATFIGYKIKGLFGGILATFSVVTPSVVIITIIAKFLEQFENIKEVRYAFNGIRVAVCVLILNAVIKFWKSGVKDGVGVVIFAAVFVISLLFDISSAWVIVGAVVIGILASIWKEKTL
ncbi:MAG: chromate transporter, partial [Clostridia bacterium]|nr:chromate transporter [Clostridia bacterium]